MLRDATVIGGAGVVNGSSSSLTRRCREPAGTTAPSPWMAYTPSFGQSRDASAMPVPTNLTMAKAEFCRDRGKVGAEAMDVVAVLQGSHAHLPAVTQSNICRSHAVPIPKGGKSATNCVGAEGAASLIRRHWRCKRRTRARRNWAKNDGPPVNSHPTGTFAIDGAVKWRS